VIWLLGDNLSQEQKCFSVGNLLISVPISLTIFWARSRLSLFSAH